MPAWDLIIFDNDGVLVDSERLANRILADLLTDAGYPVTIDDCVRRFLGGTLARVRALVEADLGRPLPADLEDQYHNRLFAGMRSHLRPVAGVEQAIKWFQSEGIPCCVASSGTHARIQLSLSVVGLLDRFDDRIVSADDVARGKPAPDLFLRAAAVSGAAPERCLVVEDSPAGVAAGKAAGMTVVGYVGAKPAAGLDTSVGEICSTGLAGVSDEAADAVLHAFDALDEAGADDVITDMVDLPEAVMELVGPTAG